MVKYFLRHKATIDLDGIADYIAESSVKHAIDFYNDAQAVFNLLADMPEIGNEVDLHPFENLRMFPMKKYELLGRKRPSFRTNFVAVHILHACSLPQVDFGHRHELLPH